MVLFGGRADSDKCQINGCSHLYRIWDNLTLDQRKGVISQIAGVLGQLVSLEFDAGFVGPLLYRILDEIEDMLSGPFRSTSDYLSDFVNRFRGVTVYPTRVRRSYPTYGISCRNISLGTGTSRVFVHLSGFNIQISTPKISFSQTLTQ